MRIQSLVLLLLSFQLHAQPFQWAVPISGASARGMAMVTDEAGNVYVCGNVNGVADFDPGPGEALNVSAGINGDNYLVKYGPSGNYLWHFAVGGSGTEIPKALVLDHGGGLVMVGRFDSFFDWDPGEGTTTFGNAGSTDGFVAKYDTSGNFQWAQRIGGTGHDEAYGVDVDEQDNIYITGWMGAAIDFDNGPGTATLSFNGTGFDAYHAKYGPDGGFKWVKAIQGVGSQRGMSVAYGGDGHIYLHGVYSGVSTIEGNTLVNAGSNDIYLCKVDTAGNLVWVRTIGGPDNDAAEIIRSDRAGHLYITGTFRNAVDFDPGPGVLELSTGGSATNLYVAKLDTAGNALWAHRVLGNNHFDGVSDVVVDVFGNVFITGTFFTTVDFDPGPEVHELSPVIANDLYLVKFDPDGEFIWARSIVTDGVFDTANGLATDADGNVFVTGGFGETAVFDSTLTNGTLTGTSSMVGFTAKYGVDFSTSLTPVATRSEPFLLYPNPTSDRIQLVLETSIAPMGMVVTDSAGRVVMEWRGQVPLQFSTAKLVSGNYHVRLFTTSGMHDATFTVAH